MPRLHRWALQPLLSAILALMALTAWSDTAWAGVDVTIQPVGGAPSETINTDDVAPDVTATYVVGSQRIICQYEHCISVIKLLAETETESDYATIEIPRANGARPLRLTRKQVEDPDQPVFYTDRQGVTRFIGAPDPDRKIAVENYFEVEPVITLTQHRASKIKVEITPTEKKVEPGDSATFKAKVTGAAPEEEVVFNWGLKGGKRSRDGATHTHEFPKKDGNYELRVSASIEGSDIVVSDSAEITVGDPNNREGDTGPNGEGDGGSADDSIGSGPSTSAPTPNAPTPAPYIPVTPPSTPTPRSEPSAPSIATDGSFVEGNLLADAGDPPSGSILESAARAARNGTRRDSDVSGGGVPEAAVSLVVALALLALGAALETRQGRLLRLRLPRRAG